MKTILVILVLSTLTACDLFKGGGNNNPEPVPVPSPQPTPTPNVCDPATQPSPHWGTRDGECLKSCGALGGIANSDTQICAQLGLIDAGKAYDVAYCCKDATPQPSPTPKSCPGLKRWGIGLHIIMNKFFQLVPSPEREGFIIIDTTPKFGCTGVAGACNGEHDNCGGRECEPKDGPEFSMDGPSDWKNQSNPYQIKIGPLEAGHHEVTARNRNPLQDGLGEPLKACGGGDSAGTVSFDVP